VPIDAACLLTRADSLASGNSSPELWRMEVDAGGCDITSAPAREAKWLLFPLIPEPATNRKSRNIGVQRRWTACLQIRSHRQVGLGNRVVLAMGLSLNSVGRCGKDVAGYDLLSLLVGSKAHRNHHRRLAQAHART